MPLVYMLVYLAGSFGWRLLSISAQKPDSVSWTVTIMALASDYDSYGKQPQELQRAITTIASNNDHSHDHGER